MEKLFVSLLNNSIAAGFLVLAIALLRLLPLRMSKEWRCLLWELVYIRLLFPAGIKSRLSLVPSAQTLRPQAQGPAVQSGISALDGAVNPLLQGSLTPAPGDSVDPGQLWLTVGMAVWLVGLAALLLYALVSTLRLKRRVAEAVPLRENIRLCGAIQSPFVLGLLRPMIYLPFGLDGETQELVIAHEQAHIRRLDPAYKLFAFLVTAVCWFNPLLWLAYGLLGRDIELACDERALKGLGQERRKDYSRALLACAAPRHFFAASPVAFGETGVKQRIRSALRFRKPGFWAILLPLVLLAVLALCFLTDPADSLSRPGASIEAVTVFDGNTGRGLEITEPEELARFTRALEKITYTRDKPSLGYSGTRFRIAITGRGLGWREFILNSPDMIRKDPFFYRIDGGEALYELLEELFARANEQGDREVRGQFMIELVHGLNGLYPNAYTPAGFARDYGEPFVQLPNLPDTLRDSGLILVRDGGAGAHFLQFWVDEIDRAALLITWVPGAQQMDGFSFSPSWAGAQYEAAVPVDGAVVSARLYSAEELGQGYFEDCLSGIYFAAPVADEAETANQPVPEDRQLVICSNGAVKDEITLYLGQSQIINSALLPADANRDTWPVGDGDSVPAAWWVDGENKLRLTIYESGVVAIEAVAPTEEESVILTAEYRGMEAQCVVHIMPYRAVY